MLVRAPEKVLALAGRAEANGWDAQVECGEGFVDVTLLSDWKHPDTGEGWRWGAALRWYRTERGGWRLGSLDPSGKRVVGGVASKLPDGPEFEYWLGSLKMLEDFILEPADFVAWFDEVAPR